jgi:hypothetical protein
MYSPSAKHAPHSELSFTPANTLVGSDDGNPKSSPQKGSLYAWSAIFEASVMYHAVIK